VLSLDERAGNVVTTVAVFMAAGAILYLARGAFLVFLLSLLFAYLIEPAVTWIQDHSRLGWKNRSWAILQVYLIGALVLGCLGYKFGPSFAAQVKSLSTAVPGILEGLSNGSAVADAETKQGLSAAQQLQLQNFLTRHHTFIAQAFERGAAYVGYVAASAIWLFAIPILAIFILNDGREMLKTFSAAFGVGDDQNMMKRIFRQLDTMLAKYIRAQLFLASLSLVFYVVSMALLGFPYAIALGFLGGALEFLPAIGWIASAVTILTVGFLTHSHWIWMAGLLVLWRLLQDYVNSPRIMGDSLGLQPLTVVFALMVGGQVGGIAGVYLSVPAAAVLRIVWMECVSAQNHPTPEPTIR
jgi:predicted PurR-regulated permease PerM